MVGPALGLALPKGRRDDVSVGEVVSVGVRASAGALVAVRLGLAGSVGWGGLPGGVVAPSVTLKAGVSVAVDVGVSALTACVPVAVSATLTIRVWDGVGSSSCASTDTDDEAITTKIVSMRIKATVNLGNHLMDKHLLLDPFSAIIFPPSQIRQA